MGILTCRYDHSDTKGHSITPDVAVPVCHFSWVSMVFQRARGHVANLKGLVFVCYLSARHRPSQVTATPQPICVITTTFSHFPDNVLHPPHHHHPPSQSILHLLLPPLAFLASINPPHFLLLSIIFPYFILLLLTLLYFSIDILPNHHFILLLNLLVFFFLFLVYLIPLPVLITFPLSSRSCYPSSPSYSIPPIL